MRFQPLLLCCCCVGVAMTALATGLRRQRGIARSCAYGTIGGDARAAAHAPLTVLLIAAAAGGWRRQHGVPRACRLLARQRCAAQTAARASTLPPALCREGIRPGVARGMLRGVCGSFEAHLGSGSDCARNVAVAHMPRALPGLSPASARRFPPPVLSQEDALCALGAQARVHPRRPSAWAHPRL